MFEAVDARGVTTRLDAVPRRIVSLVPSTTETLFDLGVGRRVVGVTRFCVHPTEARQRPFIGGTKDVDVARVRALTPDLIVGNCEENTLEAFDALSPVAPVWAPLPRTVPDALDDLLCLGCMVGARDEAERWRARIGDAAEALGARTAPRRRVVLLIWRGPWMAVGSDTFASAVLRLAGLDNALTGPDRYPQVQPEQLRELAPDLVLLSSEPFPFRARHADELAARTGLPRTRFRWVDGEHLTWHGTRLATGLPALAAAPDLHEVPA